MTELWSEARAHQVSIAKVDEEKIILARQLKAAITKFASVKEELSGQQQAFSQIEAESVQ